VIHDGGQMGRKARYFFHVVGNRKTIDDKKGTVFAVPELAMIHAAFIAVELAQEGDQFEGSAVSVLDGQGNEVARIVVTIATRD
jgi:hypothetical protein